MYGCLSISKNTGIDTNVPTVILVYSDFLFTCPKYSGFWPSFEAFLVASQSDGFENAILLSFMAVLSGKIKNVFLAPP